MSYVPKLAALCLMVVSTSACRVFDERGAANATPVTTQANYAPESCVQRHAWQLWPSFNIDNSNICPTAKFTAEEAAQVQAK